MAPVDVQSVLHADEEGLKIIFEAYDFRDKVGHPLLLCADFEMLIAEYFRLKHDAQRHESICLETQPLEISAELNHVDAMLTSLPSEDVLGRLSLESRKHILEAKLASLTPSE